MIHSNQELIKNLSFHDEPILKMDFNPQDKKLKIYVKGTTIYDNSDILFQNRTNMWLGKGVFVFKDWNSLVVDHIRIDKKPIVLDLLDVEQLDEIFYF